MANATFTGHVVLINELDYEYTVLTMCIYTVLVLEHYAMVMNN